MALMAVDGTSFEWHGDSGSVVVLIHGLGLNKAMWQWQVPVLAQSYRVLTYDLYGHGDSQTPPSTPDLTLFSTQLLKLLDENDIESCAVLGFSLGGMICRRFAMDHPGRVSALGILHSPHKRKAAAQDAILKRVAQARQDGPSATVEAALDRWFTEGFRKSDQDRTGLVRRWVMANSKQVYPSIYQVLADGVDELVAPDPAISCPTLVMTGDEDFGNSPEMSQAIAGEISGAQIKILPGLRHMAMVEDPGQVNTVLLSFLDRVKGVANG
ncbi:alpha/beta fold hydrolase [Pelagibius sp. Alg239-R121]|uniref:alpha/beta fold hydrolase n=1 Tax=Pelagibius sp. Alg239-R121 TaxID=2993448 RepID=UPI0024A74D84|nr:alpha/beta fold hydrolase [Pelagibius sp. Alg239-R121]